MCGGSSMLPRVCGIWGVTQKSKTLGKKAISLFAPWDNQSSGNNLDHEKTFSKSLELLTPNLQCICEAPAGLCIHVRTGASCMRCMRCDQKCLTTLLRTAKTPRFSVRNRVASADERYPPLGLHRSARRRGADNR